MPGELSSSGAHNSYGGFYSGFRIATLSDTQDELDLSPYIGQWVDISTTGNDVLFAFSDDAGDTLNTSGDAAVGTDFVGRKLSDGGLISVFVTAERPVLLVAAVDNSATAELVGVVSSTNVRGE